jgi:hypothetical protein
MDYLAPHAYEVAKKFKTLGKIVVGGEICLNFSR